jgi:hypothetical protein
MDVGRKSRPKGQISARVYRAGAEEWEDLGVIAKTNRGVWEKIRGFLGIGPNIGQIRVDVKEPKAGDKNNPTVLKAPKGVKRIIGVIVFPGGQKYRCLMEDGSEHIFKASAFEFGGEK